MKTEVIDIKQIRPEISNQCTYCRHEPWYRLIDPKDDKHYLAPYPGPQKYCGHCGSPIRKENTGN